MPRTPTKKITDVKDENALPLIVTRGIISFPACKLVLDIGRPKTIKAIDMAMQNNNNQIIVTSQINPSIDSPKPSDMYQFGTVCTIVNKKEASDGGYTITVKGVSRAKLTKIYDGDIFSASYTIVQSNVKDAEKIANSYGILSNYVNSNSLSVNKEELNLLKKLLASGNDPVVVSDIIANAMPIDFYEKQDFLEELNVAKRLETLVVKCIPDSEKNKIDSAVSKKVSDVLAKQQKEFYLREKMRAVKDELATVNTKENESKAFSQRVQNEPYPEYIKEAVLREIDKLDASHIQEAAIIKSQIEWLLNLPYWQATVDNADIVDVEKKLNESHYGLEKVKKRILEYLALKIRNPKAKAPILCLAGAPGVGKTSLAKSIANALGKVYIKMSLGGMHDESEIRGHRKTYLGSMPGRIIKCMRQAKVNNPLFLLDEIDKLGVDSGNKGDPSSALLEVLDPEQNSEFVDNFIEEKYDLSNVMFVATANYIDRIPSALLDRLELIELSSYTEREKLEIAKNYLVKRAKDECLIKDELEFDDASLLFIIRHYTRESGVRELTRIIQTVCRKFIVNLAHDKTLKVKADEKLIVEYLGKVLYDYTSKEDGVISGIVNGMAYTSAGGDLLKIEATVFPGKGNIIITGNLKETMKESAQVALGFVRSNAAAFGIKDFDFANKDIHIHAPAGGIPKDGPSAGVTLTTAIISSIRNVVIPNNISMTGEITLRGKVGIVGGIKEKVISAFRGGVNEIFLPKDDERYLEDVPAEIKDHITFHLIDKYTDIYDSVFKKK